MVPPINDKTMWRRLLRLVHPDTYGDHELFLWVSSLKEAADGNNLSKPKKASTGPVDTKQPFTPHHAYTSTAIMHERVLSRLDFSLEDDTLATRQQLAKLGKLFGMTQNQRYAWYEVAKKTGVNRAQAKKLIDEMEKKGN